MEMLIATWFLEKGCSFNDADFEHLFTYFLILNHSYPDFRFFVTPSDSVAIIAANAVQAIPYFSGGLKGVARFCFWFCFTHSIVFETISSLLRANASFFAPLKVQPACVIHSSLSYILLDYKFSYKMKSQCDILFSSGACPHQLPSML